MDGHVIEGSKSQNDAGVAYTLHMSATMLQVHGKEWLGGCTDEVGNEEEDVLLFLEGLIDCFNCF